jgi:hypothetical protein
VRKQRCQGETRKINTTRKPCHGQYCSGTLKIRAKKYREFHRIRPLRSKPSMTNIVRNNCNGIERIISRFNNGFLLFPSREGSSPKNTDFLHHSETRLSVPDIQVFQPMFPSAHINSVGGPSPELEIASIAFLNGISNLGFTC